MIRLLTLHIANTKIVLYSDTLRACFMTERKRLHLSPLDSGILPIVLPQPLLQRASNISLHSIDTFPEKNYGYIDLPALEADKLKRKLNGSVLRGFKLRVEDANPKRVLKKGDMEAKGGEKKLTRSKRTEAREDGVIPGMELPTERKVKRGWTEPETSDSKSTKRQKDARVNKKKKAASVTGESECLFKTKLPPNAGSAHSERAGKAKKRKRGNLDRDIVVHEFSNTTKHAKFLRDGSGAANKKSASEYVEGKGWVDDDGNVIEAEPQKGPSKAETEEAGGPQKIAVGRTRSRKTKIPVVEVTSPIRSGIKAEACESETSSSGTSDSEEDQEDSPTSPAAPDATTTTTHKPKEEGLGLSAIGEEGLNTDRVERLSITPSSPTSEPETNTQPEPAPTNEVHPLEALFKRPKGAASQTPRKPNLEVSTTFNFFDPDDEDGADNATLMPQTPFSQQDIRFRRQRSAAPTPDTAAPGKTFGDVWGGVSEDISEGEEEDGTPEGTGKNGPEAPTRAGKPESQETEFTRQFYEQRGENNRRWKRSRREAAKEKRQRENKERRG